MKNKFISFIAMLVMSSSVFAFPVLHHAVKLKNNSSASYLLKSTVIGDGVVIGGADHIVPAQSIHYDVQYNFYNVEPGVQLTVSTPSGAICNIISKVKGEHTITNFSKDVTCDVTTNSSYETDIDIDVIKS